MTNPSVRDIFLTKTNLQLFGLYRERKLYIQVKRVSIYQVCYLVK